MTGILASLVACKKPAKKGLSAPNIVSQIAETAFSGTSFTTAPFTVPNNCLLVAFVNVEQQGTATLGTVAIGALTCSVAASIIDARIGIAVITAPVTSGGSMTLSATGLTSALQSYYSVSIYSFTGYNAAPVGATATGNAASAGAISITLSGTPAASSAILAGRAVFPAVAGGPATEGAGWTELYDNVGAATFLDSQQQWITGSTSTTVPWAAQMVGDVPNAGHAQIAVEIKAA